MLILGELRQNIQSLYSYLNAAQWSCHIPTLYFSPMRGLKLHFHSKYLKVPLLLVCLASSESYPKAVIKGYPHGAPQAFSFLQRKRMFPLVLAYYSLYERISHFKSLASSLFLT